jgi:hypothetical protein
MLIHEVLQEQIVRDRKERVAAAGRADVSTGRGLPTGMPGFVRTIAPAFTHGLFGLPAPQRAARGGC